MNKKYIAFFDLDDTILSVNSGRILIKACYSKGLITRGDLLKAYWLSILFKLRIKSSRSTSLSMIKWLKGTEAKFMQDFTGRVVNDLLISFIRPEIREEINTHQKNGGKLVMLSAALTFIVKPIAEFLNFDDYICSNPEVENGYYTGKPNGPVCVDNEKEIQIREYCRRYKVELPDVYFYGDSWSDRFALKIVGHPVCVQPDSRLLKLSVKNKWKRILTFCFF
ncbi:MAG: HAD-IB family hydrolase [Bacteroidales bacterium]|nr:HAD-IB family hydrolase [Bacteroidales bacterium]MBN2820843.1 HAD-IB family hydrolase [Bacteroidales bacterium]